MFAEENSFFYQDEGQQCNKGLQTPDVICEQPPNNDNDCHHTTAKTVGKTRET